MKLIINTDRSVIPVGTWGTVNENNYEILEFEFPAELEHFNKRIVYYLGDKKVWDAIVNNKAYITNAITTKEHVKAYVWLTERDDDIEKDIDFRTQLFEMNFYENENADGIVPTEEQVDGFNTMLTAMNAKITEIDTLETAIEGAEADRVLAEQGRVNAENTRVSNENTRQSNEQTRQSQEAERERRTDEAIADIQDKTAEYNANAEAKTNEFNQNATQKTNDFNSNYTQKVNEFNSNASSKTSDFNSNAETKTNAFNTNATNKTNDFDSNATEKTTTFNDNASTKTTEFNTNAESKTSAFNDNATQKTTNFDNNASEKTDEFNNNAQEKIDEYDEHIADYQAQIDELQEEVEELSENMPWGETEQATEIQVTDAAKYSRNKLELFGNTEQTQYTGKNCFNKTDYTTIATGNNGNATNVKTENKITIITGDNSISSGIYITKENLISYITNYDSSNTYYVSLDIKANRNIEIKMGCDTRPNFDITTSNQRISVTTLINSNGLVIYSSENNAGDTIEITNIMISTASDTIYEPFVGNQPSPSPDYPQPIHVVSGNNTVGVQGKNLFDKNVERKNAFSTGDIGQVVGYGNSSASYSYVNCAKVEANKTYTLSWKIDGTKGATSNRNSKIVDSNNIVLEEFATWINNTTHITFTPQNTGYLVLTTDISSVDIQLEQGSTVTDYTPYYHADYPINLGSLELCKIGDRQDYFYKENGNWYKYEVINKKQLTSNMNWVMYKGDTNLFGVYGFSAQNSSKVLCTHYQGITYPNSIYNINNNEICYQNIKRLWIRDTRFSTLEEFKEWLDENVIELLFVLSTATKTQITDTTLIAQLDEIYEHLKLVKGTNNITVTAEDLAPYMKLTYMQDLPSKLDNLDSRLSLLE